MPFSLLKKLAKKRDETPFYRSDTAESVPGDPVRDRLYRDLEQRLSDVDREVEDLGTEYTVLPAKTPGEPGELVWWDDMTASQESVNEFVLGNRIKEAETTRSVLDYIRKREGVRGKAKGFNPVEMKEQTFGHIKDPRIRKQPELSTGTVHPRAKKAVDEGDKTSDFFVTRMPGQADKTQYYIPDHMVKDSSYYQGYMPARYASDDASAHYLSSDMHRTHNMIQEYGYSANQFGRMAYINEDGEIYASLMQIQDDLSKHMGREKKTLKKLREQLAEYDETMKGLSNDAYLLDRYEQSRNTIKESIDIIESRIKKFDPSAQDFSQRQMVRQMVFDAVDDGMEQFRWPTSEVVNKPTQGGLSEVAARRIYEREVPKQLMNLLQDSKLLNKTQRTKLEQHLAKRLKGEKSDLKNPMMDYRENSLGQLVGILDLDKLGRKARTRGIPLSTVAAGTIGAGAAMQGQDAMADIESRLEPPARYPGMTHSPAPQDPWGNTGEMMGQYMRRLPGDVVGLATGEPLWEGDNYAGITRPSQYMDELFGADRSIEGTTPMARFVEYPMMAAEFAIPGGLAAKGIKQIKRGKPLLPQIRTSAKPAVKPDIGSRNYSINDLPADPGRRKFIKQSAGAAAGAVAASHGASVLIKAAKNAGEEISRPMVTSLKRIEDDVRRNMLGREIHRNWIDQGLDMKGEPFHRNLMNKYQNNINKSQYEIRRDLKSRVKVDTEDMMNKYKIKEKAKQYRNLLEEQEEVAAREWRNDYGLDHAAAARDRYPKGSVAYNDMQRQMDVMYEQSELIMRRMAILEDKILKFNIENMPRTPVK